MNLVKYLVKSDRNLTYFPCCIARHKRDKKVTGFNTQAKWILLCGTVTIKVILNLRNNFELGITSSANIKRVFDYDYLFSIYVNLPENSHYFFLDLSVGGAHLCDSMKLFVALLPFLGLVYCSAAPTDIEKRSAMGLYIMIVFLMFSILCLLNVHYIFLATFLPNKYE